MTTKRAALDVGDRYPAAVIAHARPAGRRGRRGTEGGLPSAFGPESLCPHATLFKDWAADALTATSENAVPNDHAAGVRRDWITGAWQERLSLAGNQRR